MLIVPIGRENGVLQRQALVCYSIIAVNIIVFLLVCIGRDSNDRRQLLSSWRETISYFRDRPYLRPPVKGRDLMPEELRNRAVTPDLRVSEWRASQEQKRLDAMAADLDERYDRMRDIRMAYVPVVGSWLSILTSMFLHAGIAHLVGNMLFLFATGPFVEDAYGRPLFLALYLSGGIAATLTFASRNADSVIPLVGASGAIAAVMGAYLVRFFSSKIVLMWFPVIFLPFWHYRFSIPAAVLLPLWFLEQIVSIPMEGGGGVAITAHVGGFAYGLLFGMVQKLATAVKPADAKDTSPPGDPKLAAARDAFRRHDIEYATREVNAFLVHQPADLEGLRLATDIALRRRDAAALDEFATRLLSLYAATRQSAAGRKLVTDVLSVTQPSQLSRFLAYAAGFAERSGDRPWAIRLYAQLTDTQTSGVNAVAALVKLGTLRKQHGDAEGAREAFYRALGHPNCSSEWQVAVKRNLLQL